MRCLQYINGSAKPVVTTAPDVRSGHSCDIVLKPDLQAERKNAQEPAPSSWKPTCTCEVCQQSTGGDISGDDFAQPGVGRTGRRKGRRGKGGSRLIRAAYQICPNASLTST